MAQDLTAVLDTVGGGSWRGRGAQSYVGVHRGYVGWLRKNSVDYAQLAVRQQEAAVGYIAAVAAMPTLAELAANHVVHGLLVATNFFGINTIPIALNETDYVRMWIQAATTMGIYQGVGTQAVAAAPPTTPAPILLKTTAIAAAPTAAAAAGPVFLPGVIFDLLVLFLTIVANIGIILYNVVVDFVYLLQLLIWVGQVLLWVLAVLPAYLSSSGFGFAGALLLSAPVEAAAVPGTAISVPVSVPVGINSLLSEAQLGAAGASGQEAPPSPP